MRLLVSIALFLSITAHLTVWEDGSFALGPIVGCWPTALCNEV